MQFSKVRRADPRAPYPAVLRAQSDCAPPGTELAFKTKNK